MLIKQVEGGTVSHQLARLVPGAALEVDGPFGYFLIPEAARECPLLFVASGTGIAPFHCFARSYTGLDYRLLHGVRTATETYDRHCYPPDRYLACLSREPVTADGGFAGRVTAYLDAPMPRRPARCAACAATAR